jgi:hypothetical protein
MSRKTKRETPQQKWARRQKRRGNCFRCGGPRIHYKHLCDACQAKFTAYMRRYREAHSVIASQGLEEK